MPLIYKSHPFKIIIIIIIINDFSTVKTERCTSVHVLQNKNKFVQLKANCNLCSNHKTKIFINSYEFGDSCYKDI